MARSNLGGGVLRDRRAEAPRGRGFPNPLFLFPTEGDGETGVVVLPRLMDLDDNIQETVEVIRAIRVLALSTRRSLVHVNMDRLERISSGAALMLAAEIDRCLKYYSLPGASGRRMSGSFPMKGSDALETMAGLRIFERLSVRIKQGSPLRKRPLRTPERDLWFRFTTGGPHDPRISDRLVRHYARHCNLPEEWCDRLQAALVETTSNVGQHAYLAPSMMDPWVIGRWWLMGRVNPAQSLIHFALYDQGLGVPETMRMHSGARARGRRRVGRDPDVLLEASEWRGSRLPTGRRGKGLEAIDQLVNLGQSKVVIWSGAARLDYDEGEKVVSALPVEVVGTLVEWRRRLPA